VRIAEPRSPTAPPAVPEGAVHPHADDIAEIRRHHVGRADVRATVEPEILLQTCRYESDIASPPPRGRVALTFDDGPEPGQTEHILDVLTRHRIPATFFMIGAKVERYPQLVARVRAHPGARIGNHTWDHPNFHELPVDKQCEEIRRGAAALSTEDRSLFRFPFGNSSCEANAFARELGYRIVGWHVDSCDWAFERTGRVDEQEARACGVEERFRQDFVGHVLAAVRARRGGIVLLHENHPNTIRQLEAIVEELERDGYAFGALLDEEFGASLR
jgi:peptidoglycan-N-acetylglucosamine deacetylase